MVLRVPRDKKITFHLCVGTIQIKHDKGLARAETQGASGAVSQQCSPRPWPRGLGARTSLQASFCRSLDFIGALPLQKGRLIRTTGRIHTGGGTRGSLTPGRKTASPAGGTTDMAAMLPGPENEGRKGVRPTDASCSTISKPPGHGARQDRKYSPVTLSHITGGAGHLGRDVSCFRKQWLIIK